MNAPMGKEADTRIATVCSRDCYDTCGLVAGVDSGGRLVKVEGDLNHPVTAGLTCPRAAGDHLRVYRNRIQQPVWRQSGQSREISWDKALDVLAARMEQVLAAHGPEAILLLDYCGNCGLLAGTFYKRLWSELGVTSTDHALCNRSGKIGIGLHYGRIYGVQPQELVSRKLVVFWGFNAATSAPHLWIKALEGRRQSGARIVVVDPLKTRMAQAADLWIRPRPGSDVALAWAVMRLLVESGRVDLDFIARQTTGFEDLKDVLFNHSLDDACHTCAVDRESVAALAELYGNLRPSATMIGIGMQKNDHGADQVRAVCLIPALLGIERGFYYSNSDGWDLDLGGLTQSGVPCKTVSQPDLGRVLLEGRFKLVFVSGTNPVVTLPGAMTIGQALAGDGIFTVVHDTHWTQTARLANLVLPALTYLEKEDLVIPWSHPYVRLSPRVIRPVTAGWSEVDLMGRLARRLGCSNPWLEEDPWQVLAKLIGPALADGTWQDLRAGRLLRLRARQRDSYQTPSGKLELAPQRARQLGCDPVPLARVSEGKGRFRWLTSATVRYTHSQFQEVYGAIADKVTINPHDAAQLKINPADMVVLSNRQGRFVARAEISDKVPPGVLWSARPIQDCEGNMQNQLVPAAPQSLGGGSRFNSTWVDLEVYHTSG